VSQADENSETYDHEELENLEVTERMTNCNRNEKSTTKYSRKQ